MVATLTTFRLAATDADLTSINTFFNTKVAGVSIVDELVAEGWPSVMAFTLAVWRPIMQDSAKNYIPMGFDALNRLRGAGWWRLQGDTWEVRLIGVDKSLTAAQRTQGLSDCFQWNAARLPGATKFSGYAKANGRIDQYLSARLPAARRTVISATVVLFGTTAAEALALLK